MNTITGTLLGIVQGLTEFLPISSSGHLVLFQNLLGFKEPELLLDCALHFGTLVAIFIYFRADLRNMITESYVFVRDVWHGRKKFNQINETPHASLALWILVGTLPTVMIGLTFRSTLESLFGSINTVGFMMVGTGMILVTTRFLSRDYNRRDRVGFLIALAVGTAQGLALIPGISRSGATIVCGVLFKLRRDLAARFSFLLSIPAIIGALLLQIISEGIDRVEIGPLISGIIFSTLVGLLALKILMGIVRKGNLFYFAPYCWALGLLIILT